MNAYKYGDKYVFAPTEPSKEHIERLLQSFADAVFVWIENPADSYHKLGLHGICGVWNDDKLSVRRTFGFIFGEYYLNIFQGCVIKKSNAENNFEIEGKISFDYGKFSLNCVALRIDAEGLLKFGTKPVADKNIFEKLGAGIRYAKANKDETDEKAFENGFIDMMYNPVFYNKEDCNFNCSIYPLNIRDETKSYLQVNSAQPLETSFINTRGETVTAKTNETSKLVFRTTPYYLYDSDKIRKTLTLGFSGSYDFYSHNDILCGFNGVEFLKTAKDHKLHFGKGNGFITAQNELSGECETSYLKCEQDTIYYAQPKTAPLFAINAENSLTHLPTPQYKFGTADNLYIPLMPYSDIVASFEKTEKFTEMESVLSKVRNNILSNKTQKVSTNFKKANGITPPNAVSTQGLFIWLREPNDVLNNWDSIGFSKVDAAEKYIRFINITPEIRTQYQAGYLFIVYDKNNSIPDGVTDDSFSISLEGFGFDLRYEQRAEDVPQPVMIVKFRTDKSIMELSENNAFIKSAVENCKNENNKFRKEFNHFIKIINDANFQGVIFLNPKVSILSNILPELKIMIDAVEQEDLKNLTAHHLIFPRNKITVDNGIVIEPSKFTGIIDYKSKRHLSFDQSATEPCDADFLTVAFFVNIEDSEIKQITSVSELLLNKMFGEFVTKKSEGGNSLIIDGELIKQNGQSVFKYTLRGDGIYDLKGKLKHVSVNGISLTVDANSQPRFTLNGKLYFACGTGGDLFCYGLDKEEDSDYSAKGLPYNNLIINNSEDKFAVSLSNFILNPQNGVAREDSMARRFPYYANSFTGSSECGGKMPEDSGFIVIQSPEQQSKLDDKSNVWYGVVWRVPLGSLGDLSEGETIDLQVLTAWSPVSGCFVGVKLPFGGNGFDVQGLLKLGFKAITISLEPNSDTKPKYIITLTQFAVSLLSFTFPPGNNKIVITASDDGSKLGWFAGYKGEVK